MQIPELASNITLRLFLRPFEAVLSFKSLFEGGSRGYKGLIFYMAGSFYAPVFMSMFLRPRLRKKLRSLEAMEAA